MNKSFLLLLVVVVVIAVAEGLYISYPSWSPLLSFLNHSAETATTTPETPPANVPAQHIDEHAPYYDITTTYPGVTSLKTSAGAAANTNALTTLKGFIRDQIDQFKKDGNFANLTPEDIHIQGLDQGRKYVLDITYKTYSGSHTVSYVFAIEEDTLGAHPNTSYQTFTFDSATGNTLTLDDILTGNYLSTLSNLSRTKLKKILGAGADSDMLNAGTTAEASSFQTFYLSGKNFVLLFAPYQVGPYALGPVTLPIPLTELSTNLKAKYK